MTNSAVAGVDISIPRRPPHYVAHCARGQCTNPTESGQKPPCHLARSFPRSRVMFPIEKACPFLSQKRPRNACSSLLAALTIRVNRAVVKTRCSATATSRRFTLEAHVEENRPLRWEQKFSPEHTPWAA